MIAKKVDMPALGIAGPCKRRFENTAGYCGYVTRRPRWYPRIMRGASLDPHIYIYIYHHISSPSSCSLNWVKEIKRGIRKIDVEDSTGQLLSNFFFCIYAWNHRSSEIVEGHQNMTRASFRDIVGVFQYLLLFRSYTCTHTHTQTHTHKPICNIYLSWPPCTIVPAMETKRWTAGAPAVASATKGLNMWSKNCKWWGEDKEDIVGKKDGPIFKKTV